MTNENTINNKEMLNQEQLDSVAGGVIAICSVETNQNGFGIKITNDEPKKKIGADDAYYI